MILLVAFILQDDSTIRSEEEKTRIRLQRIRTGTDYCLALSQRPSFALIHEISHLWLPTQGIQHNMTRGTIRLYNAYIIITLKQCNGACNLITQANGHTPACP